jgi:hypothetical protein
VTLRDAGDRITSLPMAERDIEEWQMAIGCLIGAAEGPRLPMRAGRRGEGYQSARWAGVRCTAKAHALGAPECLH